MAAFTTSPVSGTLYLLLRQDRIVCSITGAASVTQEDIDFYDGSTHSQLVDASILGNAHTQIKTVQGAQTAPVPVVYDSAMTVGTEEYGVLVSSHPLVVATNSATGISAGPEIPAVTPLNGAITESAEVDMSFVTNTTPGKTVKSDTLFKWWSAAGGSGNLVAFAWKSQIRYCGPVLPTLLT